MSQHPSGDSLLDKSGQPLASAFVVPHPTRPNEDTFCICPLWFGGLGLVSFFGVYDGHSGSEVSRFLAASLHQYVQACGMGAPDTVTALCQAFQTADAALEEATLNCPDAGSTATVALLSSTNVVVAHCGDSRALLCRSGHVIALTDDHRPARNDERERVLGSGGKILWNEGERVMGVLATTRAFGDRDLKQFGIIAEPEVTVTSRSAEDEFLILATDGVFNVLQNEEVADVARRVINRATERGSPRAAAIRMAASAIGRFSRDRNSKDDITVVVVDLATAAGVRPAAAPRDAAAAGALLTPAVTTAAHHHHQHQTYGSGHQVYGSGHQMYGSGHQVCGSEAQQQRQQQQPSSTGACCSPNDGFVIPSFLSLSASSASSSSSSSSSSASFLLPPSPDGSHPQHPKHQQQAQAAGAAECGALGNCCGGPGGRAPSCSCCC